MREEDDDVVSNIFTIVDANTGKEIEYDEFGHVV
jgi:hypothetical protein